MRGKVEEKGLAESWVGGGVGGPGSGPVVGS